MPRPDPNTPAFRAAELGALLARHYPAAPVGRIATVVNQMQSAARAAKSWEERRCNHDMAWEVAAKGERTIERTRSLLNEVLKASDMCPNGYSNGVTHSDPARISLGGDCRGACGSLHIPGLSGDGWGNGFAIY
jgi:hypothetical protein